MIKIISCWCWFTIQNYYRQIFIKVHQKLLKSWEKGSYAIDKVQISMHLFEVCLCSGCLFLLILFLICAIGITCINIDPVFYLASLLLGLGTAGLVDAGPCLCLFSLRGSSAWLGLYYATYWYLGHLVHSLIIGPPARMHSLNFLFCWPVVLPPGGLLCLDLWYFICYAAVL